MRAACYSRGGALKVVDDFPVPSTQAGELLVKVAASSVNPVDVKLRKGNLPQGILAYPKVTGSDASGVVMASGAKSKFKPGDLVYFMGNTLAKYGCAATLTVVPEANVDFVPIKEIDIISAASLPLAFNTAWQALEKSMPLQGKQVLIQAGSGGVGALAIQIAAAQQAHITTTCSAPNAELCKSLGAERIVDYKTERFEDAAPPGGFDCVMNLVDGDYDERCIAVTKKGGHFAQVLRNVANPQEWLVGCRAKVMAMTGRLGAHSWVAVQGKATHGLQQCSRMISEGKLKPIIRQVFPLDQIADAHGLVDKGGGPGKVVVKLVDDVAQLMEGVPKPQA